jgi:hypothetical protein
VIGTRLRFLDAHSEKTPARDRYDELTAKFGYNSFQDQAFLDNEFSTQAAEILQFPPELFVLRMREAYMREELERVKRKLRELELDSK